MSKKPTPAEGVEAPVVASPSALPSSTGTPSDDQAITTPPSKSQTPPPVLKDERDYDGASLKQLREALGLSVRDMADKTKITAPILMALEEERFTDVPSARVYVRGFVRCVARELNVDMDQVARTYVPRWEKWHATHEPE